MKFIKILIFSLFFTAVFCISSKASAIDENQPGYYGYKSRRIITETLVAHNEVPADKRAAIIDMLSKDGYFWMKTKEQKLNYIHAKLAECKYLSIVADAENVHSWNVQPSNSQTINYGSSTASNSAGLKDSGKQFIPGSVNFHGVMIVFQSWGASQLYNLNASIFEEIANRIIWLRKRTAKVLEEKLPNDISFDRKQFVDTVYIENNFKGAAAEIYPGDNSIYIYYPLGLGMMELPTMTERIVTHEFGHIVHDAGYRYLGDTNDKKALQDFIKRAKQFRIYTFDVNWNEVYSGYMQKTDFRRYFNLDSILGEHPWDNDQELFATSFEHDYLPQYNKAISNPPKINKQVKSDEMQNLIIFAWESMATLVDGDSPTVHPFLHKSIKEEYNLKEIYEGKFWND